MYRTVTLPVVLYGCESWSLTLREGCRPRVFENVVLRRICEPKRDEVTGEWRRLHKKALYALYSSPDIRVISQEEDWGNEGWGNLREGDHLKDRGVDGMLILKCIFERLDGLVAV
jgi:hypothetical protein